MYQTTTITRKTEQYHSITDYISQNIYNNEHECTFQQDNSPNYKVRHHWLYHEPLPKIKMTRYEDRE